MNLRAVEGRAWRARDAFRSFDLPAETRVAIATPADRDVEGAYEWPTR